MAGHYINTVEDQNTGRPVNGATIKVYQDGATIVGDSVTSGTLATIYSDDGVTTINQTSSPVTTSSDGEFDFYTNETRVIIEVSLNGSGLAVWNDIDIIGGTVSSDVTALSTRVDNHDVLTGTAANATDLGTFTYDLIADNETVKGALQDLEDALKDNSPMFIDASNDRLGILTASPDVPLQVRDAVSGTTPTIGTASGCFALTGSTDAYGFYAGLIGSTGAAWLQAMRNDSAVAYDITLNPSGGNVGVGEAAPAYKLDVNGTFGAAGLATFEAGANLTPAAAPATNAVGYLGSPQIATQTTYTLVMADAGKHYYHTAAGAHTLTIPANASVAFPIGTVIAIVNGASAGNITLAITSDTLVWGTSTGSRTLAAGGVASLLKVAATTWVLSGDGIA